MYHSAILKGKRIFIIEGDVMNLGVFNTCLSRGGAIGVHDVFGYGIVKRVLENLPVDLILPDILLRRGLSGHDGYDDIRDAPSLSRIPIIAATSLDAETEIPKVKAKGFDGFIGKPINVREFVDHIAKALDGEEIWVGSR